MFGTTETSNEIYDRLAQQKNIEVDFQEVLAISKKATLARPHLARLLVEKNYVANQLEAFQRYLVLAHEETRQPYF